MHPLLLIAGVGLSYRPCLGSILLNFHCYGLDSGLSDLSPGRLHFMVLQKYGCLDKLQQFEMDFYSLVPTQIHRSALSMTFMIFP